jgi:hypothetical protein
MFGHTVERLIITAEGVDHEECTVLKLFKNWPFQITTLAKKDPNKAGLKQIRLHLTSQPLVVESEGSIPLIPKPTIGHDPELKPSI